MRSRIAVGVGFGLSSASIILVAIACGDSLEVEANEQNDDASAVEGGVGVHPDAALVPLSDGAPVDLDPDEEVPLNDLPDASCSDASFLEEFLPKSDATVSVVYDGGTQMTVADGYLVATVNNVDAAASYVRHTLCNAPPAVTCTMRLRVNELVEGQISLVELKGIDNGQPITIRIKTNETQITGTKDAIPNDIRARLLQTGFATITITAKQGEVLIEPGGIKYDAGLASMKFTEIRGGIIYLTRRNIDTARAAMTVDSIACQFGP